MAEITRQQNLLVAEDWKKIYQSFRSADFQAYDYENLRKAMIDYLRLYYPEDFNDFIESAEYIALIDLLAFLGQSLAFRSDLNTRENFIDTAERRDSVLRLAKLISYKSKRNNSASGLLKVDSVSTTETLYDSEGVSLTGTTVFWNDNTNSNWLEQFVTIMNAAFISGQRVGKPGNSQTINGIKNDEYRINSSNATTNIFKFQTDVQGAPVNFEVVGATTQGESYIYEVPPGDKSTFSMLYRNDSLGNASNDTGWFVYFKQGQLQNLDLNFAESLANRVVNINVNNVNNTDVWFYTVDNNGLLSTEWTQVPSVGFTNIVYNKTTSSDKQIYEISSRLNDQIDLIFGDGVFATIPQGTFRVYFRTGNNLDYKIVPNEISNVLVSIPYTSKSNRQETLTLTVSLKYTINNAASRETLDDIKQKAPQQYYTQNRMVNGEDYNILPFTNFNNVVKVKAINRTSSGISRFLDVADVTGKYSSTNIFCDDGIIYKVENINSFAFEFANKSDIQNVIETKLLPLFNTETVKHFYYYEYDRIPHKATGSPIIGTSWIAYTIEANKSTGYFIDSSNLSPQPIGDYVAPTSAKYFLREGSIIKFYAGDGKYFNANRVITEGVPSAEGENQYIYATITSVDVDGVYNDLELAYKQVGPVALNEIIPGDSINGYAIVQEIIPVFSNSLTSTVRTDIINKISEYKNFGLGYDQVTSTYYVITEQNLDINSAFSQDNAQDNSLAHLDSSWLVRFETDGSTYNVYYRGLDYIFESSLQTRFYFDNTLRVFDVRVGAVIEDTITVLKFNTKPDSTAALVTPIPLSIYDNVVETDGYVNNARIKVTFNDLDSDGIPADLDFFTEIVGASETLTDKKVFYFVSSGVETPLVSGTIVEDYDNPTDLEANKQNYVDGTIFYTSTTDEFYTLSVVGTTRTLTLSTAYIWKVGRQDIAFQYRHNSPNNRRIDPSPNNIIDLYILTSEYNDSYRAWLADTTGNITEPEVPTSEDIRLEFQDLENYKMISDTIIYNNPTFKPLFGSKADSSFQATFKVVKAQSSTISDTEIQVRLVTALNNYFAIENWDFGETFYYTELSAYLHKVLAPDVSSIILVSKDQLLTFGSLFQIDAQPDEIFVSAATVDDVVIIPAITSQNINQGA